MIKRTITYKDYNDVERTEDFYFHLNKAELMELELSGETGSLEEDIQKIIKSQSNQEILAIFKRLLLASYGVKSDDGKRFMKSPEIRDAFEQNPAYAELYIDMFTNVDKAVDFFKGILPNELAEQIEATPTHVEVTGEPVIPGPEPILEPPAVEPTREELLAAWEKQNSAQV